MKVKKESAKTRLHLNIKRTKITTAEEIHNFNIGDEVIEIVKYFAYFGSVINLNVDCNQEKVRRLRLGKKAM